jgi:hypothetical protein
VQTVLLGANLSVGQVPELPVQFSRTSHTLAAPRHTTVAGAKFGVHVVPEQEYDGVQVVGLGQVTQHPSWAGLVHPAPKTLDRRWTALAWVALNFAAYVPALLQVALAPHL